MEEWKKLLLKTSPELSDSEKATIKEHEGDLTDEDREAYADFLGASDAAQASEEVPAGTETPSGSETPAATPPPPPTEAKPPVEQPQYAFKSEEEAKAFVNKQLAENEKAKQEAIDKAKTPEQKKYVEDNWKPMDWNEAFRKAVDLAKTEIKAESEKEKEQEAIQYWQDQWTEFSKANNIPSLDTNEGRKTHFEIISLMQGFGKKTFTEGYDLWKKVNGKEDGTPTVTPSEAGAALAKAKADQRKQAAAKVGAANVGTVKPINTSGVKPFASYEEMKKSSSRGILKDL